MQFSIFTIIEAVMLAVALSTDALVASFAYGSNKIKIPFSSVQVINVACTSILAVSLLLGGVVRQYVPQEMTKVICFCILIVLGIAKLMDSTIKSIIKNHTNLSKQIKFSMFNLNFILLLYANPEQADVDSSKVLSPDEAVSLAIALSLDGLAVGFGAAIGYVNILTVVAASLVFGTVAVILGCYLGNRLAGKTALDLSWLGGVLLIVLAFLKL